MSQQERFTPQDGLDTAMGVDYFFRDKTFVPPEEVHIADYPKLAESLSIFLMLTPIGERAELPDFSRRFIGEFSDWKQREIERVSVTSPVPTSLLERIESVQIQDVYTYIDEQYDIIFDEFNNFPPGTQQSREADERLQLYGYIREVVAGARAIENGGILQLGEEEAIKRFSQYVLDDKDDIKDKPMQIAKLFRNWQEKTYKELSLDNPKMAMVISNLTLDRIADVLFFQQDSIRQFGDEVAVIRRAAQANKRGYFLKDVDQFFGVETIEEQVGIEMQNGRFPSQEEALQRVLEQTDGSKEFMEGFLEKVIIPRFSTNIEESARWLVSNFSSLHERAIDSLNGRVPIRDLEVFENLSLTDYRIFIRSLVRKAQKELQTVNARGESEAEAKLLHWTRIDEIFREAIGIAIIND